MNALIWKGDKIAPMLIHMQESVSQKNHLILVDERSSGTLRQLVDSYRTFWQLPEGEFTCFHQQRSEFCDPEASLQENRIFDQDQLILFF